MFTIDDRNQLRDALIAAAGADARISSAALTGSAAGGASDQWSDIDLALGIDGEADLQRVVADWTGRMYRTHGAIHHMDVFRGTVRFRVFLFASTLQVDLAFWPQAEFGPIAPTFRLLFGQANEPPMGPAPSVADSIDWGWLYALHARASIARGRAWHAVNMINGMRDQVLALMCLRHGVPVAYCRGCDQLPPAEAAPVAESLVRSLDLGELRRAFGVVGEALILEIQRIDAGLAGRLAEPIRELVRSTPSDAGASRRIDKSSR